MTFSKKEKAALYVLNVLDSNDNAIFEKELAVDKELQKWVLGYESTLKNTDHSFTPGISQKQLQSQRMDLLNKIDSELNKKSKKPETLFFRSFSSMRQPTWVMLPLIIIAFFIGKSLNAPKSNNNSKSVDIIQLMDQGLLTHIDIQLNNDESNPIQLALHSTNEIEYSGNLKDELIQNMLFYLLLNDQNTGKRLKVVKLLEHIQLHEKGRNVLISSMLSDPNPGVRLKSTKMLQSYVADKLLIDACVKTILEDENSAVRLSAMDILESHPTPDMIPALQVIRIMDENPYIQSRAESMLVEFEDLNNGKIEPEI